MSNKPKPPEYVQLKLRLKPSLHVRVKMQAEDDDTSLNATLNKLIEDALRAGEIVDVIRSEVRVGIAVVAYAKGDQPRSAPLRCEGPE